MNITEAKENFIKENKLRNKHANQIVLAFIADFALSSGNEKEMHARQAVLHQTFRHGYCYYFAHMLKMAFGRGEVCLAASEDHFVWKDEKGVKYDIDGVYTGDSTLFIPESYLGNTVNAFMHVNGVYVDTTDQEICRIIEDYKELIA